MPPGVDALHVGPHPSGPGEHVLDVETMWLSGDLPAGWADARRMRVSCCVVHDRASGQDLVFAAEALPDALPLQALYHFLEACRSEGCTLVGHNLRAFDWEVLAGEFEARGLVADARAWAPGAARLLDTMASLQLRLGWRPSLNALAWLNLGEGKTGSGAAAPGLWRRGAWAEVVDYCRKDVELTRRIWEKGQAEGRIVVDLQDDGSPLYVSVQW